MKIRKLAKYHPVALAALGVFFGRGAQADTILDFQVTPADQPQNCTTISPTCSGILQSFGDYAAASSDGVTVAGFGTPNIGLTWGFIGEFDQYAGLAQYSIWDYYNDGSFWQLGQLQNSYIGMAHKITFTPNSASARVVLKSFNFHPYYVSTLMSYGYNWSVLAGTNVVATGDTNFFAGAAKIPISINYTGAPGQTLKLKILRTAGAEDPSQDDSAFSIGADDITFAQLPEAVQPVGPQVVSVTPGDDQTGVPATGLYLASITNGVTTLVAGSIQLKLDGNLVSPPPSISSVGGLTNVSYQSTSLLVGGSTHRYMLSYNDNLGSNFVNEVQFTVSNYTTVPAAYALPSGAGVTRGFTYRTVSASSQVVSNIPGTIARAKAQLAGTLTNTATGLAYTNEATLGTNADGSYNIDTVLNFNDNGTPAGNFTNDVAFPGLDSGFPSDWFSTEGLLYLDLTAGFHRFGVNSDGGVEVSVFPPQGVSGSPVVLDLFDATRGAEGSFFTLFDFQVQASGIYPFRVIHFETVGFASCEFYSVTNLATGEKVLINDPTDANAVKSYLVLKPLVTSIVKNGSNVDLQWAYGVPPFQVQVKTNVNDLVWSNSGGPTSNRTASVPITGDKLFIRVAGH